MKYKVEVVEKATYEIWIEANSKKAKEMIVDRHCDVFNGLVNLLFVDYEKKGYDFDIKVANNENKQ